MSETRAPSEETSADDEMGELGEAQLDQVSGGIIIVNRQLQPPPDDNLSAPPPDDNLTDALLGGVMTQTTSR